MVDLDATRLSPNEVKHTAILIFPSANHNQEKKQTFGELLSGDHLFKAPYQLEFLVDKDSEVACSKNLTKEEVSRFREALKRDYYFRMYYDDLPIWSFVGRTYKEGSASIDDYKYFLYSRINFEIFFNKDRVVEIRALTNPAAVVDLTEDKETYVEFVYTVNWKEVDILFENRMEKYLISSSLPHHLEYHWFSIINSCVTVVLLTGFLVNFNIRVLKKDFTERRLHDEELISNQEEGWKCIQDDVFTYPVYKSLLAAALGSGLLLTALTIIYAITSSIAGYTATSVYCHLEGTNWLGNLLLTGCIFFGPLLLTFGLLNSIATAYKVSVALPFGRIMGLVLIWMLFAFPLLLLGGMVGKNGKSEFQAPCPNSKDESQVPVNITKIPRDIPTLPWYMRTLPQMAIARILPFGAVYFELLYVIVSMWGHRIYTIYKILFVMFVLLLIIIALVNVGLTCYQLVAEDHKWWWRYTLSIFT
ncbi:Nonaspanin [Trema orientale]|uniref:Transmembrane 9 superfamily member n=1 Tax=Trema orientale TaxID=63057 RepID=A0A2P5EDZ0_TREOI|nr:Nonaspanin [Trema orientale]